MPDPRFFPVRSPITVAQLVRIGANAADLKADRAFTGVQNLKAAGPDDLSFVYQESYLADLATTKAGGCLLRRAWGEHLPPTCVGIFTEEPRRLYAQVVQIMYQAPSAPGIDPSAIIHATAQIDPSATIQAGVVIKAGASVGARTVIGAGSVIEDQVIVGDDCRIDALVTLAYCRVGHHAEIMTGTRIGQPGFGYVPASVPGQHHLPIAQLGLVVIEDHVSIGANCAIDRGALDDTIIRQGTKIDNLVHLAHNVELGEGCFIAGQTGIAGSAKIGRYVQTGGQTGISGHISVADGVRVAGQAGVTKTLAKPGSSVIGMPAEELKTFIHKRQIMRQWLKGKKS
ncbi:MAG: UDP-3-O-(3-hydroxymyristoyl)glucosamine N-acyltransferase [Pseudomonadota bacterium]